MEMAVKEILSFIMQDIDVTRDEIEHFRATEAPDYVIEQAKGKLLGLTYVKNRIMFTYGDFDE